MRREREQERKRLVALGILKEVIHLGALFITSSQPEVFKPCRNQQFPHKTSLRNPDVFNTPRRFSWTHLKSPDSPSSTSSAPSSLSSTTSLHQKNQDKRRLNKNNKSLSCDEDGKGVINFTLQKFTLRISELLLTKRGAEVFFLLSPGGSGHGPRHPIILFGFFHGFLQI